MDVTEFGRMPDGTPVPLFTLRGDGLEADVFGYGARIAALRVPVAGGWRNVTLGHAALEPYVTEHSHLGATAGRFANRIGGARFTLDGKTYDLPANNGPNTLHGGPDGFAYRLWAAAPDGGGVAFTLVSPAGDQGFPGQLTAQVRYTVAGAALVIDYTATTDAPTVLNLTNHAYFNLAGGGPDAALITDHVLTVAADRFVPTRPDLIPTGDLAPVAGTAMDFRTPHRIGERIDADEPPLKLAGGYDHCYVLADAPRGEPMFAARVEAAGLTMETWTTEPAVQVYSGNFLKGQPFKWRTGLCLETQHFPDSPNQPQFPSTVLRPGETFRSRTVYRFAAT